MASKSHIRPLKIIFLPFPAPGHMLHMSDLAKTLASNGVECNVITTPINAHLFETSDHNDDPYMKIHTLPLPTLEGSVENFGEITSGGMRQKLFYAISMLREPTEALIRQLLPIDCLISDMFYPWSSDFCAEIGVPRVLQKASIFNKCCAHSVEVHVVHEKAENDEDLVALPPSLPHKIVMKKSQLPKWVRNPNAYTRFMEVVREAEAKCYGVLANTFSDKAEKEYIEYYTKVTGLKVWNIGPLCLRVNRENDSKTFMGYSDKENCKSSTTCLSSWLDKKKPNSVLYVSFGSMTRFPDSQLREIAAGLEASGHHFIWAVKKKGADDDDDGEDEWSIEEFRKKMEASNKGLIIQGWVPQILILRHQAIGGMVTHCGWNTILEGVSIAGVPLVTWPLFAEQFYNEKLMVDVLKIGVAVGVSVWCNVDEPAVEEIIQSHNVETAIRAVMGNDREAVERRMRAKALREDAKMAVQNGGSSQANLLAFLDDMKLLRMKREAIQGCVEQ